MLGVDGQVERGKKGPGVEEPRRRKAGEAAVWGDGEEGDGCHLQGALSRLWVCGREQEEAGGSREERPG